MSLLVPSVAQAGGILTTISQGWARRSCTATSAKEAGRTSPSAAPWLKRGRVAVAAPPQKSALSCPGTPSSRSTTRTPPALSWRVTRPRPALRGAHSAQRRPSNMRASCAAGARQSWRQLAGAAIPQRALRLKRSARAYAHCSRCNQSIRSVVGLFKRPGPFVAGSICSYV